MAIILRTDTSLAKGTYLNIYPDQFRTEKEKQNHSWIKDTMDYFSTKAYAEYLKNDETIARNYDLVKGILRKEDFYEEPQVKSFTDMLTTSVELPKYVQHYSIISTPLNELVGEITKRPDDFRVKAFDDDSRSEELEYRTEILNEYILSRERAKINEKLALQGIELPEEEIEQLTLEQVQDKLGSYTSIAESWGNHLLTAVKAEFNLKEKSEDAFRDLNISNKEFYHIYEDNSKLGFNIEVENPKNVWYLTVPDRKFTSDPSGRQQGAYAAGTVKVMELSEIIENEPDLEIEEINHLRSSLEDYGLLNVRKSNLEGATPGIDSIKYDTYNPLIVQERMIIESSMKENPGSMSDLLGLDSNVSAFGFKYVVVTAYWVSKKKIAKVTYEDEVGNIQTILVDETYKSGDIPTEISIEWGWINQMYQGKKIGPDIYHVKPFKLLDYIPIIGVVHEIKNTEPRSTVDMMKPFQVLYNICMNQLFELLQKEIGNVGFINIRRVPRVKDGDAQDDIDMWELEARERGIIFEDDSPENLKGPISNTSVPKNVDLTRTNEIQSRYNLAVALKNECWELIGMSKQRLGSISASESATGTNAAIAQSYSQTEPLFVIHEYVLRQLYQAIIDASLYIESQKETSTISYIAGQGEAAFVQINGADLKFRDLKVFPTNRPEDKKMFEELRQLSQAVIQNGGSLYEIIELYSTNSVRQMKKVFKNLRDKLDQFQQETSEREQQAIIQEREIAAANLQQQRELEEVKMANDNFNKAEDRINKKEIAIIQALGFGKQEGEDLNSNEIPDLYEASRLEADKAASARDYQSKLLDLQEKRMDRQTKLEIEKEKLKVAREKIKADKWIAVKNKNKYDSPSKAKKKK